MTTTETVLAVKPLEWQIDHVGGGLRAGEYRVRAGLWTHGYYWLRGEEDPHTGFVDQEEACAAAQADHKARILSQVAALPGGEVEPVARRDALLAIIKDAAIKVAGRSANKRGPFVFDEAELQALASRLATPNPAPSVPVAWMWPHMLWPAEARQFSATDPGDVAGKAPLYAAPPSPQVEITDAMVEAAWRVIDGLAVVTHDDVRAAIRAALSPTGRAE